MTYISLLLQNQLPYILYNKCSYVVALILPTHVREFPIQVFNRTALTTAYKQLTSALSAYSVVSPLIFPRIPVLYPLLLYAAGGNVLLFCGKAAVTYLDARSKSKKTGRLIKTSVILTVCIRILCATPF